MKEVMLTGLYWFLNLFILLVALAYALKLWGNKNRHLIAISLFIGGTAWHIVRAIYTYRNNNCEYIEDSDKLLIIANKCIPAMADDVIWAQIALFIGLFVLIAELFKHYTKNES